MDSAGAVDSFNRAMLGRMLYDPTLFAHAHKNKNNPSKLQNALEKKWVKKEREREGGRV